uniref:Putative lipase domain protein n=1 Tax=Trypanosoma vivax (strain Y486) TaxID=1055687 RepID=G0TT58_TRYVY|nr:putative lipase domain protein [Trypanosoma vivax Y486]
MPPPSSREVSDKAASGAQGRVSEPRFRGSGELGARRVIPRAPKRNMISDQELLIDPDSSDHGIHGAGPCVGCNATMGGVELQIEGLSPLVCRVMLFVWYAVLILAVVVECLVWLEWEGVNICGESGVDIRNYENWNSSCVTKHPEAGSNDTYTVRWEGGNYHVHLSDYLLRFRNIVLSLRSPDDWNDDHDNTRQFVVKVPIPSVAELINFTSLPLNITCVRSRPRCEYAQLVPDVVLKEVGDSKVLLELRGVPGSIARRIDESSVGIIFQKRLYSVGVLVWRYVFLLFSFMHLLRFIVNKKYTNTIYEQVCVLVLQLVFLWYLNPLSIICIGPGRPSLPLEFLELHFSWWFMAVLLGFIFAVITASMPRRPVPHKKGVKFSLLTLSGIKAFLCHCRSIYDPPFWTKIVTGLFVCATLLLDIHVAYRHNTVSLMEQNAGWSPTVYILGSLLVLGGITCCCLLVHLNRNLGKKSYLDSRPQQLACRVFILVFVTALLFNLFHFAFFYVHYLSIPGMLAWQPLIQLPSLMVSTFLVNIMTLVYTTRNRNGLVPIHPRDARWKRMVWPDAWYRWLARHGGSMYIFYTEAEETSFNWTQLDFRVRQYLAKEKKNSGMVTQSIPSTEGHEAEHNSTTSSYSVHPGGDTAAPGVVDFLTAHSQTSLLKAYLKHYHTKGSASLILNMDMTSTWFLPTIEEDASADLICEPITITVSNGDGSRSNVINASVLKGEGETGIASHGILLQGERDLSQPGLQARGSFTNNATTHQGSAGTICCVGNLRSATALRSSDDDICAPDQSAGQASRFLQKLGRAQNVLTSLVRKMERNLITQPIQAFEQAETYLLDVAQRPFQDVVYLPFFNLETSIDCFNLSYEAYRPVRRSVVLPQEQRAKTSCCCLWFCTSSTAEPRGELHCDDTKDMIAEGEGQTFPEAAASMESPLDTEPPVDINLESYGYRLHAAWEVMNVQVIIAEMDTTCSMHRNKAPRIVIAFRGTINMSNAWQDMQLRRVPWDEMLEEDTTFFRKLRCFWKPIVHSGFLSIWSAHRGRIYSQLSQILDANPGKVYRIFCTGHSMGGAVASLCAYSVQLMLRRRRYPLAEVTVYTFGQPPMGNRAFQSAYNRAVPRTFRVVNESDVVAFLHVYATYPGIEVNIDRHGNYICKPTYIERLFHPMRGKGFMLENHMMGSYAASLNAIAKKVSCPARATTEFASPTSVEDKSEVSPRAGQCKTKKEVVAGGSGNKEKGWQYRVP